MRLCSLIFINYWALLGAKVLWIIWSWTRPSICSAALLWRLVEVSCVLLWCVVILHTRTSNELQWITRHCGTWGGSTLCNPRHYCAGGCQNLFLHKRDVMCSTPLGSTYKLQVDQRQILHIHVQCTSDVIVLSTELTLPKWSLIIPTA